MAQRIEEFGGTVHKDVTPETYIICGQTTKTRLTAALPPSRPSLDSYKLVTPQFIAQSLLTGKLQDDSQYIPVFPEDQKASIQDHQPPPDSPRRFDFDTSVATPPPKRFKPTSGAQEPVHSPLLPPHDAPPTEPPSSSSSPSTEPCVVERQGSEWIAIQGTKPRFTGGNTGIPWGSFGVWDEPFDPGSAQNTIQTLSKYWYVTRDAGGGKGGKNGAVSTGEELKKAVPEPRPRDSNGVCSHIACSRRPFCLVQRLEEVKKVYLYGRDQFKIRAIDRTQQQLVMWGKPLDSDQDVDKIGLGTKSAIKVKEILALGHSSRVEAAAADEKMQSVTEFLNVWGVGTGIADRWYGLGCRTLEDVKKKVEAGELNLSEQQRVGLKYFDDFEEKIPREQVAEAEKIVRQAAFGLVERLGASDPERTYCFATGSFRRGKPESSDIDILIVLPPSLLHQNCGEFLHSLQSKLLDRGLLVDEMGCREARSHGHSSRASWMGVCQVPGVSTYRRIDFKLYTWQHAVCAVNYFANSMSVCRATRYWANNAVPEAAKKYHPDATGFKISDLEMVAMKKMPTRGNGGGGGSKEEPVALGEPIELKSETDLYEKIGLSYVPVHMRYFYDYF